MTELSQDDFTPKSFILFSVDEDKNAGCELNWGESKEDIAVFAALLQAITTGELNDSIRLLLEDKAKESKENKAAVKIIYKAFKNVQEDTDEVVVDPLNVELFI